MKIVIAVGLYPYQIGGAEMQGREIALALKNEGHEIFYMCYSSYIYNSSEFNLSIILTRSKYDIFYWGTKKKIYEVLDKIKPDLVYHRVFVPYSRFIGAWCYKNSVPFYFHSANVHSLNRKNNTLYNIIHNIWLKETLEYTEGVICQNSEQFKLLQKFKLKRVQTIYNMHNSNTKQINMNKKFNIVWIAKFTNMKQPEIFVEFAERCFDENLTFTMFSSNYPQTEFYKKLLERILINKRISIIIGKENDYINEYLCENAAILVNTSKSEGLSNTFIQAWMRGVPVVSLNSNPDGFFDRFKIGACCNGNKFKIDEKVRHILNKDNYYSYVNESIRFAEENFSIDAIKSKLFEFMRINI